MITRKGGMAKWLRKNRFPSLTTLNPIRSLQMRQWRLWCQRVVAQWSLWRRRRNHPDNWPLWSLKKNQCDRKDSWRSKWRRRKHWISYAIRMGRSSVRLNKSKWSTSNNRLKSLLVIERSHQNTWSIRSPNRTQWPRSLKWQMQRITMISPSEYPFIMTGLNTRSIDQGRSTSIRSTKSLPAYRKKFTRRPNNSSTRFVILIPVVSFHSKIVLKETKANIIEW